MPRIAPFRKIFSRPVSSAWNPVPTSSRLATRPRIRIRPRVGSVIRLMILRKVDLPAPLRPTIPTTSPVWKRRLRPSRAQNSSPLLPLARPDRKAAKGDRIAFSMAWRSPSRLAEVPIMYRFDRSSTSMAVSLIIISKVTDGFRPSYQLVSRFYARTHRCAFCHGKSQLFENRTRLALSLFRRKSLSGKRPSSGRHPATLCFVVEKPHHLGRKRRRVISDRKLNPISYVQSGRADAGRNHGFAERQRFHHFDLDFPTFFKRGDYQFGPFVILNQRRDFAGYNHVGRLKPQHFR